MDVPLLQFLNLVGNETLCNTKYLRNNISKKITFFVSPMQCTLKCAMQDKIYIAQWEKFCNNLVKKIFKNIRHCDKNIGGLNNVKSHA